MAFCLSLLGAWLNQLAGLAVSEVVARGVVTGDGGACDSLDTEKAQQGFSPIFF